MATPPNIRRIRTEDFKPEDRPLIERLSFALNEFMDQTVFIFNKRIDFRNLNQQLVDIDVSIDGSGALKAQSTIRSELTGRAVGVSVVKALNLDDINIKPPYLPYVEFTINTGIVKVTDIKGLQNNSNYRLTLLLIGENV